MPQAAGRISKIEVKENTRKLTLVWSQKIAKWARSRRVLHCTGTFAEGQQRKLKLTHYQILRLTELFCILKQHGVGLAGMLGSKLRERK